MKDSKERSLLDPNTKRLNERLFNTDTQYAQFSGKSPLSSHKTTLKQQINGQKRWKMWKKNTYLVLV